MASAAAGRRGTAAGGSSAASVSSASGVGAAATAATAVKLPPTGSAAGAAPALAAAYGEYAFAAAVAAGGAEKLPCPPLQHAQECALCGASRVTVPLPPAAVEAIRARADAAAAVAHTASDAAVAAAAAVVAGNAPSSRAAWAKKVAALSQPASGSGSAASGSGVVAGAGRGSAAASSDSAAATSLSSSSSGSGSHAGSSLDGVRGWALCSTCPTAVCFHCLFPSPTAAGAADEAARAAFLAAAAERSLSEAGRGASSAAGQLAGASDAGAWMCNGCCARREPGYAALPWCQHCSAPLAGPARPSDRSYFACATPFYASSCAWPVALRCESCHMGLHGVCAARSGAIAAKAEVAVPSADGASLQSVSASRTIYLCRSCAPEAASGSVVLPLHGSAASNERTVFGSNGATRETAVLVRA